MSKRHIRSFGKTFAYLKDPTLREQEAGSAPLTVDGAEFSGEVFRGMDWQQIVFKNCDFIGNYEFRPNSMSSVRFEDCSFRGVLSYGVTHDVRFLRCKWRGQAVMYGERGSRNTVFESCDFTGSDDNPNHWGGVGTDGEASFVGCSAKWFGLQGAEKLMLSDCELRDCEIETDSKANSGAKYLSSSVTIERCKLRGKFDMAAADLQSLTIRDTVLEHLDLSGATIKGDVVMERIRGGVIKAGIQSARRFAFTRSEIFGPGEKVFVFAIAGAQEFLLEDVNFGTDLTAKVSLGAGRPLRPDEWRTTPSNQQALIRRCTFPNLDATWLETYYLRVEGSAIGSLSLSDSHIDQLELTGNTINRVVDLSNTQVKQSKLQGFAKGQLKLDGSNIRPN